MIRLGVVGCGSVVQQYHLPAAAGLPGIKLVGLADVNPNVLEQARSRWPAEQAVTDYRELRNLDAVLVASPHSLHAPMCEHFLAQGIHVLVEKPMVLKSIEAEKLLALAQERKAVFAVGVFRRYYPVSQLIRAMIRQEWLGGVVQIDAEEGGPYDWELQSRYLLNRQLAGGGVLIDTGSHMLDRLLWWLEGARVRLDDYADDSDRGVEADCIIRFQLAWQGRDVPCRVELSRTRTLRNTVRLTLRQGWIEVGANTPDGLHWSAPGLAQDTEAAARLWMQAGEPARAPVPPQEYFRKQLADFTSAIETGMPPVNAAAGNLEAVRLIEECYRRRRPMAEPWNEPAATNGGVS